MNESVLSKINSGFDKMSKRHKQIAAFITSNYNSAVFMTAAELAQNANVSESTVVRFAYHLGFSGYPDLQKSLQEYMTGRLNAVSRIGEKYGQASKSQLIEEVLKSDMARISDTISAFDVNAFDLAVEILSEANNIYVIGLRSCEPLARFLHFYLNMIQGNATLIGSTNVSETFEQMIRITKSDALVAISFPRYSIRTLKAMEFANDRMARCISITDSIHSPMSMHATCSLLAKSEMVSVVDSLVAPLSVINALIIALCIKSPKAVAKHLEELEHVWSNYQVYTDDEMVVFNGSV